MSKDLESRILSVADAKYFAKRRVPKSIFQMFEAGSGSNKTAIRNVEAFEKVMFRPRNAIFHHEHNISTTVLGHTISMPAIEIGRASCRERSKLWVEEGKFYKKESDEGT